ncbi:MAG TPA: DegT/DnrJ/EryC1/StrS family aminotransferase [Leptolyngbyaceae cyanobacterium]
MNFPRLHPRLPLHISIADLVFCLFSFFYKPQQALPTILKDFAKNERQVLVTLSVRTAFDLLLQSLNLPSGSEVLMTAVNIGDMVEIIKRHNLVPIPIDISLDTLAPDIQVIENLISSRTRIILVAHLFGSVINLTEITKLCQKYQLILVEDCAQAFCGDKYCGNPEANVSLFSFGPIKSCTALGGAIACIRDKKLAEKMSAIAEKYPQRSEWWFCQRVLKYFVLKLLSLPWIYYYLIRLIKLLGWNIDSTINSLTRGFYKGDILSKIRYRPPQTMVSLLWRRLNNFDNGYFERRESKARFFISLLDPEIICPGSKAIFHSFWVLPILTDCPENLIENLRNKGFDSTRGNTSIIHLNDGYYGEKNCTVNALMPKQVNEQFLYLPISKNLAEKELVYLANLLNQANSKSFKKV